MKVLIFEWGTGSYTHKDIVDMFTGAGIAVRVVSYEFSDMNEDDFFCFRFDRFLCECKYDFVYSTNYFPLVAECCMKRNVKYVSWCYDAPLDVPDIERTLGLPCNKVFMYDRLQTAGYQAKGFDNVYHLPLAINCERLDKIKLTDREMKHYSSDVSFVGSLYNSSFRYICSRVSDYHKGFLEAIKAAQQKIYGYYFVDDVLTEEVMEGINKDFDVSREALSFSVAAQITRDERLIALKLLSNHFDVKYYSSEQNENLSGATYMGTVKYLEEMPKVFRASKINLNASLKIIKSGISLRMLDIMGAGGFLLTNYQPELAENFVDGEEVVMYDSIEDMYEKARFYLGNEEIRKEIAIRGNIKVKQYFSYKDRLSELLKFSDICI